MTKQIIFIITVLITLGVFAYSVRRIYLLYKLTKKAHQIKELGKRIVNTFEVAFLQTKIFRFPLIGFFHALVFWGFCVICVGSIEMIIDGIFGLHQSLSILGPIYNILIALIDIFAYIISILILIFIFRRIFMNVKRFSGKEMTHKAHTDANFSLFLIFILMISLIGMNYGYVNLNADKIVGSYPITSFFNSDNYSENIILFKYIFEINWWLHILGVFFFANYLPYSKHFHVFMSIPNVFFSDLKPLGKLYAMESITREVKIMMDPNLAFSAEAAPANPEKFGVKDIEDVSWKNYFDSLACTQCGRCTSVCPANITGKKLSPRKLFIDLRARMNEKGTMILKKGKEYNDNKSLIRDYISTEELWACTTCNACAKECPVNINHPRFIIDMRRYLVMEESAAPAELNAIFSNIENNGAPWQFSPEDRLLWTN